MGRGAGRGKLALETEGLAEVWVTALDEGEIAKDEAVTQVAMASGSGSLEIRHAPGGAGQHCGNAGLLRLGG